MYIIFQADNPHEISRLIPLKNKKKKLKDVFASVLHGTLRVKHLEMYLKLRMTRGNVQLLNRHKFSIEDTGILPAQNYYGPLKWAKGPCPIQIHVKFRILMGLFKF